MGGWGSRGEIIPKPNGIIGDVIDKRPLRFGFFKRKKFLRAKVPFRALGSGRERANGLEDVAIKQKPPNLRRSAIAPVGMVAEVSINTI